MLKIKLITLQFQQIKQPQPKPHQNKSNPKCKARKRDCHFFWEIGHWKNECAESDWLLLNRVQGFLTHIQIHPNGHLTVQYSQLLGGQCFLPELKGWDVLFPKSKNDNNDNAWRIRLFHLVFQIYPLIPPLNLK